MSSCTRILISVADAFGAATGRGRKRVSTLVLGSGKKLDEIASGADLTTRSFERAMLWFSDNWPDHVERPEFERCRSCSVGTSGSSMSDTS